MNRRYQEEFTFIEKVILYRLKEMLAYILQKNKNIFLKILSQGVWAKLKGIFI